MQLGDAQSISEGREQGPLHLFLLPAIDRLVQLVFQSRLVVIFICIIVAPRSPSHGPFVLGAVQIQIKKLSQPHRLPSPNAFAGFEGFWGSNFCNTRKGPDLKPTGQLGNI